MFSLSAFWKIHAKWEPGDAAAVLVVEKIPLGNFSRVSCSGASRLVKTNQLIEFPTLFALYDSFLVVSLHELGQGFIQEK